MLTSLCGRTHGQQRWDAWIRQEKSDEEKIGEGREVREKPTGKGKGEARIDTIKRIEEEIEDSRKTNS